MDDTEQRLALARAEHDQAAAELRTLVDGVREHHDAGGCEHMTLCAGPMVLDAVVAMGCAERVQVLYAALLQLAALPRVHDGLVSP